MRSGIASQHWMDTDGAPAGGCTYGIGFSISWQNGPLGRGTERREPNGAFVEDVLQAIINRLEFYQDSPFACEENSLALWHLKQAARVLDERTKRREAQGIEGTHTQDPTTRGGVPRP